MKPILEMTNVEKATLLIQLLPKPMIEAAMQTTHDICIVVRDSEFKNWDNPVVSAEQWKSLAARVKDVIEHRKGEIHARLLAEQLFDGYLAIFSNHCFQMHAKRIETPQLYKDAIQLLYCFPVYRDTRGELQLNDTSKLDMIQRVFEHYENADRKQDFFDVVSKYRTPEDDGESDTIMLQKVSKMPNLFTIMGDLGTSLKRIDKIVVNIVK